MIEIALLGGVSVECDGVTLSGEAAQRRRVALLALLATPALRPVSRDRLIGLLWPDHDEESARHLLSSALYVLRRALGQDALQTTVDEVALNPALVHSDVAAFRQAVGHGELERSLELYGGEFMDGFFVNDAVDFTQWVEEERAELRRLYGTALEGAAQLRQDAGAMVAAADAWRRRAALDPYEPRIALALMRALDAANQRPAAIQHARVHAMLLEQEFGTGPDPQVEALAAALRQQPAARPPADSSQPAAAAPVPERRAASRLGHRSWRGVVWRRLVWQRMVWRRLVPAILAIALVSAGIQALLWRKNLLKVGVRPFVADDTALASTALGLTLDLLAELPRIGGVRVMAGDVSFATRDINSLEANRRLGTDVVLNLRLRRARPYVGDLELVDRRAVNLITAPRVEAMELGGLREAALERIAAELKRKLREPSPSVVAADSADPDAVRHYIAGRGDWYQRTPASLRVALDHFDAAVRIDPRYARGWLGLAETLALLGSYDYAGLAPREAFPRAEDAARRALRLDPSLGDAHAALGLVYMNYSWDWDRAEAEFKQALDEAEDQASAREWYALLLAARGRIREAMRQTVRAVELEPMLPNPLLQQAHILYYAGEFEQARGILQEVLARNPTFVRAHLLRALVDLQSGRKQEALTALLRFRAQSPDPEPVLVAVLGYAQGRTADRAGARAQLHWLRQAEQRGQYVPPELLALVHGALGEQDQALDELERAWRYRSSGLVYLQVEPLVAELRDAPRFQALVKAVH